MTNIKIRNLNEAKNKWVIGTLPAVKEPSFQSKVLQIKYNYKPDKTKFKEETYHKHSTPIEECYLCINGALHIEIEGKKFLLKSNEILNVPPKRRAVRSPCLRDNNEEIGRGISFSSGMIYFMYMYVIR